MKKIVAVLLVIVALSSVCVFATNQFLRIEGNGGFSYDFSEDEPFYGTTLGVSVFTGWENEDFCFSIEGSVNDDGIYANLAYSRYFNNGLFAGGEFEIGMPVRYKGLAIGALGLFGVRLDLIGKNWIELGLGLSYSYVKNTDFDQAFSDLSLCLTIEDFCPISDSLTMICSSTIGGITLLSKINSDGEWESVTSNVVGFSLRVSLKYSFPAEGFKPHLKTK